MKARNASLRAVASKGNLCVYIYIYINNWHSWGLNRTQRQCRGHAGGKQRSAREKKKVIWETKESSRKQRKHSRKKKESSRNILKSWRGKKCNTRPGGEKKESASEKRKNKKLWGKK